MTPHWTLEELDFRDIDPIFKQCGRAVVKHITKGVLERKRPDGSPQKPNKLSTVIRKGHDIQLYEHEHRFAKETTYTVTTHDKHSIRIGVANPEDSNIAAHLVNKGYDFFGITDAAEKEAFEILETWVIQKIKDKFEAQR